MEEAKQLHLPYGQGAPESSFSETLSHFYIVPAESFSELKKRYSARG